MKWILYLLVPVFLLTSCGLQEKEQALKKKEAQLNQKEQELIAREKALEFKEQELATKQKKLDTLSVDSAFLANPRIPGLWSVKMNCTSTTCTGSALGDTKNEQWIISYEARHVIARVMAADKLVRVYTGAFTDTNTIELTDESGGTPSEPATKMVVRLSIKDEKTIEGQREITRDNDCKIVYALEMGKQNDK
jgi:hypothetical protein